MISCLPHSKKFTEKLLILWWKDSLFNCIFSLIRLMLWGQMSVMHISLAFNWIWLKNPPRPVPDPNSRILYSLVLCSFFKNCKASWPYGVASLYLISSIYCAMTRLAFQTTRDIPLWTFLDWILSFVPDRASWYTSIYCSSLRKMFSSVSSNVSPRL